MVKINKKVLTHESLENKHLLAADLLAANFDIDNQFIYQDVTEPSYANGEHVVPTIGLKVLVGGKFNTIHPGHIYFLKRAESFGSVIVVLAHDIRNKRSYAVSSTKRKAMLMKTGLVKKVVIGDKKDFTKIVHDEKPDIILLGYDQSLPSSVLKLTKKDGILIERLERFEKHNTRKLKHIAKKKSKIRRKKPKKKISHKRKR